MNHGTTAPVILLGEVCTNNLTSLRYWVMNAPYNIRWVYRHPFPSYFTKSRHLNFHGNLSYGWINKSLKLTLPHESASFICFNSFSSSSTFSFISLLTAPDIYSSYWGVSTCSGMVLAAEYGIGLRDLKYSVLEGERFLVGESLVQRWNREQQTGEDCFMVAIIWVSPLSSSIKLLNSVTEMVDYCASWISILILNGYGSDYETEDEPFWSYMRFPDIRDDIINNHASTDDHIHSLM